MPEYIDLTKNKSEDIKEWKIALSFDGEEMTVNVAWPDNHNERDTIANMVGFLHLLNTGRFNDELLEAVNEAGLNSIRDLKISKTIVEEYTRLIGTNQTHQTNPSPIVRPRDVFSGKNKDIQNAAL